MRLRAEAKARKVAKREANDQEDEGQNSDDSAASFFRKKSKTAEKSEDDDDDSDKSDMDKFGNSNDLEQAK